MAKYILTKTIINNEIKRIKKTFEHVRHRAKKDYEVCLKDGGSLYLYLSTVNIGFGRWTFITNGSRKFLGSYNHFNPSACMTLESARAEVEVIKDALANGAPTTKVLGKNLVKTGNEANIIKVSDLYLEYINLKKTSLKATTLTLYKSIKFNLIKCELWDAPISNLNLQFVAEKLKPLYDVNKHQTIMHISSFLNSILKYGEEINLIPPTSRINIRLKYDIKDSKNQTSLKFEDLPTFVSNLYKTNKLNNFKKIFICLLLLTLCRKNEIISFSPDDLENSDIYGDLWRIPKEKMKAKREHLLYMHEVTKKCLLWFHNNKHFYTTYIFKKIPKNLISYDITYHGFRATGMTYLHHLFPEKSTYINLLIAHKFHESKADAAYNRYGFMKEKKELSIIWTEHLLNTTCIKSLIDSIIND